MNKTKLIVGLLTASVLCVGVATLAACGEKPEEATYTVTYVGGEGATGTAPAGGSYKKGETFTLAQNTFTKENYTFTTWSDGASTYAAGATYTMGEKNVTFTAQWEAATSAETYTVKYDIPRAYAMSLGGVLVSADYAAGATVTLPTIDLASVYLSGCTISYNIGGTIEDDGTVTGGTNYEAGETFTMPAENVTIIVLVTEESSEYYLEYDLDGGTWTSDLYPSDTITFGETISLPTAGDIAKTGYSLVGWSVYTQDNNFNWTWLKLSEAFQEDDFTFTFSEGDEEFYFDGDETSDTVLFKAVWEADDCTVSFVLGEGAADDATAIDPIETNYDAEITLPAAPEAKDGYTFLDWSDGTHTYAAHDEYIVKGTVTLTAQWTTETTYSVTYRITNYSLSRMLILPQEREYVAGSTVEVGGVIVNAGYGYNDYTPNYVITYTIGGSDYSAGHTFTMGEEDVIITVSAELDETYVPEFNLNGGAWASGVSADNFGNIPYDLYGEGDPYQLPTATQVTRTGYKLVGWQVLAHGFSGSADEWYDVLGDDWESYSFGFYWDESYVFDTDKNDVKKITFKAVWEEIPVTVEFYTDEEAGTEVFNSVDYISGNTLTTNEAYKTPAENADNFKFEYWYYLNSENKAVKVDGNWVPTDVAEAGGTIKLYAHYSVIIGTPDNSLAYTGLAPVWQSTIQKGTTVVLGGTMTSEGDENYKTVLAYLWSNSVWGNFRMDWVVNGGENLDNPTSPLDAENWVITKLRGPNWTTFLGAIKECKITVVFDWSNEDEIRVKFLADGATREMMVYSIVAAEGNALPDSYKIGLGGDHAYTVIDSIERLEGPVVIATGFTAGVPLWNNATISEGEKVVLSGTIDSSDAFCWQVPIAMLNLPGEIIDLYFRTDGFIGGGASGVGYTVTVTPAVNGADSNYATGANNDPAFLALIDNGAYTLTYDWTDTSKIVITAVFGEGANAMTTTFTVALGAGAATTYEIGIGGELVMFKVNSIVKS